MSYECILCVFVTFSRSNIFLYFRVGPFQCLVFGFRIPVKTKITNAEFRGKEISTFGLRHHIIPVDFFLYGLFMKNRAIHVSISFSSFCLSFSLSHTHTHTHTCTYTHTSTHMHTPLYVSMHVFLWDYVPVCLRRKRTIRRTYLVIIIDRCCCKWTSKYLKICLLTAVYTMGFFFSAVLPRESSMQNITRQNQFIELYSNSIYYVFIS